MAAFMLIVLVWIIIFIWALVDMLKAKKEAEWKILWLLVMLLLPIIGVIIYYFVGREQKSIKRKR